MKKITVDDAYQGMDEIDFKVMDQELDLIANSDQRGKREMTKQFFLDEQGSIILEVYWDGELVQSICFSNKGKLRYD